MYKIWIQKTTRKDTKLSIHEQMEKDQIPENTDAENQWYHSKTRDRRKKIGKTECEEGSAKIGHGCRNSDICILSGFLYRLGFTKQCKPYWTMRESMIQG